MRKVVLQLDWRRKHSDGNKCMQLLPLLLLKASMLVKASSLRIFAIFVVFVVDVALLTGNRTIVIGQVMSTILERCTRNILSTNYTPHWCAWKRLLTQNRMWLLIQAHKKKAEKKGGQLTRKSQQGQKQYKILYFIKNERFSYKLFLHFTWLPSVV